MQEDTTYRAGAIYEAYLNEGGSAEITRKDFEMFLRDQVMKDDGMLKRTSHGVYEIRTDPADRGVLFTRGSQNTEQPSIDLDKILDDSVDLTAKIKAVFDSLNKLDGIPFPAQMELSRLKASLLHSMDAAATGITATMSWCEDNMDMDTTEETEIMNMGGI
jgi:hypothetical protein